MGGNSKYIADWQTILNAGPKRHDVDTRPEIAGRARVVWERDGEEWVACVVEARDERDGSIGVYIPDERTGPLAVWLRPDDVWWEGKPV